MPYHESVRSPQLHDCVGKSRTAVRLESALFQRMMIEILHPPNRLKLSLAAQVRMGLGLWTFKSPSPFPLLRRSGGGEGGVRGAHLLVHKECRAASGHSGTDAGQYQLAARNSAAFAVEFLEGQGHGCRYGVPMSRDVVPEEVQRDAK